MLKLSMLVTVAMIALSPAQAATLRWAAETDVTSLDPYAYSSNFNSGFLMNVYEPLIRWDANLKIEPALATEWRMLEPTRWRFSLRKGVKFHNGDEFTADDVIASITRIGNERSPLRNLVERIKEMKKVDDHTVDLVLSEPTPLLLNNLTGVLIMDAKWLAEHNAQLPPDLSKSEANYAGANTNGTGPFMLESRRPDAETVLVANPKWWDKRQGNVDTVQFRPIASAAARTSSLLSGELDLITPLPVQDIKRVESTSQFKVLRGHALRVNFVNLSPGIPELRSSNIKGKNPLASPLVRKAMQQAIDKSMITDKILGGLGRPTNSMIAPQIVEYNKALDRDIAPYDPAAAKALVAEAGYPDGFEITLDCANQLHQGLEQVCQAIGAMWTRVGIKTHISAQPQSIWTKKVLGHQSDAYIIGWANTPQLSALGVLSSVIRAKALYNTGGYDNPKVNELIEKAISEADDNRRKDLILQALTTQKEDFATIPLYQDPIVWAARANVVATPWSDTKMRLWLIKVD